MNYKYIYINDQQHGRPMGEGILERDLNEYRRSCWKQGIYGDLREPTDITSLEGRIVPITAAMYADELLLQLETAVKHLHNIQQKYQPDIPFALGGYEYVIALAKGEKTLKAKKT